MRRSSALSRKGTIKSKSGASALASTLSADANARQVTRAEFQELATAVTQLRKDSLRHQALATDVQETVRDGEIESQLASDLEFASAQVAANKTAMGQLAELVMEKTASMEQQGAAQLQTLQVESEQQLTDLRLALERLEFRFRHQARDCQALGEQLEKQQELLQTLRAQVGQTQLLAERQQEHAKTFVETVQYTVSTSEAKAAAAAAECEQRLEAFQQRMVDYVKQVDGDAQEPMKELTRQLRDVELKAKRQASLSQQTLDDLVEMRQTLNELEALKTLVQREQEFHAHNRKEEGQRMQAVERKIGRLVALMERGAERSEVHRLVNRLESDVKLRVEAVLELVSLCVQSLAKPGRRAAPTC